MLVKFLQVSSRKQKIFTMEKNRLEPDGTSLLLKDDSVLEPTDDRGRTATQESSTQLPKYSPSAEGKGSDAGVLMGLDNVISGVLGGLPEEGLTKPQLNLKGNSTGGNQGERRVDRRQPMTLHLRGSG